MRNGLGKKRERGGEIATERKREIKATIVVSSQQKEELSHQDP